MPEYEHPLHLYSHVHVDYPSTTGTESNEQHLVLALEYVAIPLVRERVRPSPFTEGSQKTHHLPMGGW